MDPEGKKPEEDTTPKTPGTDEPSKKTITPMPLTERVKRHQDEVKTFESKAAAERLLSEAEKLIAELVPALEEKDKMIETLEEENRELRENTIKELEEQLLAKKTETEVLEEKLKEKKKRAAFGKGSGVLTTFALFLLVGGVVAWMLFSKSGPEKIVSTGGSSPATQTQNGATKPILLTNSAVIKQYREYTESHDPVRAFDPLLVGQLQVVSICEPEKNGLGFVLKHAIFEEGKIIAVSPPIDTYGDGRQQRGFSPCYVPTI